MLAFDDIAVIDRVIAIGSPDEAAGDAKGFRLTRRHALMGLLAAAGSYSLGVLGKIPFAAAAITCTPNYNMVSIGATYGGCTRDYPQNSYGCLIGSSITCSSCCEPNLFFKTHKITCYGSDPTYWHRDPAECYVAGKNGWYWDSGANCLDGTDYIQTCHDGYRCYGLSCDRTICPDAICN
jgi:hypothetical protein